MTMQGLKAAANWVIVELPESAAIYAGEFRRLLVRRFDHGIFYRIHGTRIVVTAVLDLRQDPTTIRRRLDH